MHAARSRFRAYCDTPRMMRVRQYLRSGLHEANGKPAGSANPRTHVLIARRGRTIERFLVSLAARPFAATLVIVLPALLLERLLRLFDLLADAGVPAGSVGHMLVDLVPQYLGLALPAALFI